MDADPQLLTSALLNLLNNAFKYTPAGGREVLRARRSDQRVLLEVEDECGGIPDGDGDLLKPFADRRQSDRTGLGLGLSIARRAVKMLGGDIQCQQPGVGCIFVIDLPLGRRHHRGSTGRRMSPSSLRPRRAVVTAGAYGRNTIPHGRSPAGTRAITVWLATSTIETSFDGPFAVNTVLPSGDTAMPHGRSPTSTDPRG